MPELESGSEIQHNFTAGSVTEREKNLCPAFHWDEVVKVIIEEFVEEEDTEVCCKEQKKPIQIPTDEQDDGKTSHQQN